MLASSFDTSKSNGSVIAFEEVQISQAERRMLRLRHLIRTKYNENTQMKQNTSRKIRFDCGLRPICEIPQGRVYYTNIQLCWEAKDKIAKRTQKRQKTPPTYQMYEGVISSEDHPNVEANHAYTLF